LDGLLPAFNGNTKTSATGFFAADSVRAPVEACKRQSSKDRRVKDWGRPSSTDRGVAIVTGGAFGIGLVIAEALLADGWKLILADLAQGPLDTARARLDGRRTQAAARSSISRRARSRRPCTMMRSAQPAGYLR
jgi:hypothetical protein